MKPKTVTVYRVEVQDRVPVLVGERWKRDGAFWVNGSRISVLIPRSESNPDSVIGVWREHQRWLAEVTDEKATELLALAAEHRRLAEAEVKR